MSYAWVIPITIPFDATMSADLASFSFPFNATHADLKSVANGGLVTENAGAGIPDCALFSDAAATTQIPYGRIRWDASGGSLSGIVKVPTHSKTANQLVYLAYANAAIVADPQDKANALDASTGQFWHGGDGTTLLLTEWKSGASFTNNNAVAAGTGPLTGHGAGVFLSASSRYLERTGVSPTTQPLSTSCVFNPSVNNITQVLASLNQVTVTNSVSMQLRATGVLRGGTGSASAPDSAASAVTAAAWNYGACAYASTTSRLVRVNGQADVTSTVSATFATPDTTTIGATHGSSLTQFFGGSMGFWRADSVVRSRDWHEAERKAWLVAGFYTVGSPAAVGGGSSIAPATYLLLASA